MIVLALALADHLQSLTVQTLGVILLSHMKWRARLAVGKAGLKLLWDMRRFAPSVMGPAARVTGFQRAVMGPTLASSSPAMPHDSQRPPATGPSAMSSAKSPASSSVAQGTGLAALQPQTTAPYDSR